MTAVWITGIVTAGVVAIVWALVWAAVRLPQQSSADPGREVLLDSREDDRADD